MSVYRLQMPAVTESFDFRFTVIVKEQIFKNSLPDYSAGARSSVCMQGLPRVSVGVREGAASSLPQLA